MRAGEERAPVMLGGSIGGECAPATPEGEIGLMMAGAGRERAA